ncbi:CRH- protein [Dimargaris verticillata]|uniref:CRH- protein n=1 Tax=Dimargaris verticillata TaxID=2761393 RepID=A0A9W8E8R7_9FUNG|nr:CRH- protein [Dimargaris verticillata]
MRLLVLSLVSVVAGWLTIGVFGSPKFPMEMVNNLRVEEGLAKVGPMTDSTPDSANFTQELVDSNPGHLAIPQANHIEGQPMVRGYQQAPQNPGYAQCEEKHYDFSSSDHLADFQIESCHPNVAINDGKLELKVTKECNATTITYNKLFNSGRISLRMKAARGMGVVTCAVMMGTIFKDEFDIEFTGKDLSIMQSMLWNSGAVIPGYEKFEPHPVPRGDASKEYNDYAVEFTPNYIAWFIDNQLVRTIRKDQITVLPRNANQVRFGVWDGSNQQEWAGSMDYSKTDEHVAKIESVTITPYSPCYSIEESFYHVEKPENTQVYGYIPPNGGPMTYYYGSAETLHPSTTIAATGTVLASIYLVRSLFL